MTTTAARAQPADGELATTTSTAIRPRTRMARLLYGPPDRPRWARPSLLALLAATAVLYLWGLGGSGYANSFYAAAVQAGTQSWKALLFGSLDPGNAITVDKPPAALWVMGVSGRVFGFNSWSMLVPQALQGVAAVALLYASVRRLSGPCAGLLAGAALALTPVAVLMFRFNNPDALLVLLLTAGAYCVVRATEKASGRWLALAGVAVGFGFLTKMLQAFLVLPAFALVYLVAAPTTLRRRVGHLLVAGFALVVSAGWYVMVVALWPASSRPYIGGSTDNGLLQLAFGYNGLGRVFGGEGNGGGGGGGMGGGNAMFGGSTGITRLFGAAMGTEISWLLPAALIGLVAGLWFTRRTPRAEHTRAALLLWGGWLVVTGIVFSFMQGTIHPYYMVALAPAIAALIGISVRELWRGRRRLSARLVLALMVATTGVWDYILLERTSSWAPALRWCVLVAAILAATGLVVGVHQFRKLVAVLSLLGLLGGLGAGAAYAVDTAARAHAGSIPTSGPESSGFGGHGGPPGGGSPSGGPGARGGSGRVAALLKNTSTRWAAATVGSQSAASLELSTAKSVMAIGGFTGTDDSPTLAQFQSYVAGGEVRYFISGDGPGGRGGGDGAASRITSWVESHFTAHAVDNRTVYDLNRSSNG